MPLTHAIVVFGCPAFADGTPRSALRRRLERALEMARAHPDATLVVSGGSVRGPVEAEVMQRWLSARGVDASRILCERAARSTVENAALVTPFLRQLGATRVTLVTERFHARRSRLLLGRALSRAGLEARLDVAGADDGLGPAGRAWWAARELFKLWFDRR